MEYVAGIVIGLLAGSALAWLITTKRAQSELVSKVEKRTVKLLLLKPEPFPLRRLEERFAGSTKKYA